MENTTGSVTVLSIEETLAYHLEYNLEVPMRDEHIPGLAHVCALAIAAVNDHDLDRKIPLPEWAKGVSRDGERFQYITAKSVVAKFHLDQWLNAEWF